MEPKFVRLLEKVQLHKVRSPRPVFSGPRDIVLLLEWDMYCKIIHPIHGMCEVWGGDWVENNSETVDESR